jgi:hypothetical protein
VERRKILTLPGLELRSFDRPARSQSLTLYIYIYLCVCANFLSLRFISHYEISGYHSNELLHKLECSFLVHELGRLEIQIFYTANYLRYCLVIYLWLYSPFVGLRPLFSSLIFHTASRFPRTGDQLVEMPLPAHTGQHKHRINTHRHPRLKLDSNPRSQCSSGRRYFMP